jgi:nitrilase
VIHCTALMTEKGITALQTAGGPIMSTPGGGSSAVFGPDGRRLTDPVDQTTETIIYADLNMDDLVKVRMFADCTGHYSRPDLLWLGVSKGVKPIIRYNGDRIVGEVAVQNGA